MTSEIMQKIRDTRDQNLIKLMEAKKRGVRVVGLYCAYCPREIILAASAIPVSLCGNDETVIPAAEKHLPRNLCPLVKSSYGLAVTDTCPFFHLSDMVIGETTCDGKKKMFELISDLKTCHVMNLPQMPDEESSVRLWHAELVRLKRGLEEAFDVEITDEKLRAAIHITNEEQRVMKEFFDLNRRRPALVSGMDMISVSYQTEFALDCWEGIAMIEGLVAEISKRQKLHT